MPADKTMLQEPIAIIGMSCIFPQAADLRSFWRNILASVDAVGEPLPAWEASRYLASRRINTSFGGYLRELYRFDPRDFGIMPNSVDGGEPDQFLALKVARDALLDAGYLTAGYDHQDTGIVLGHSTYLHRGQVNHIQHHIVLDQTIELLQALLPGLDADRSARLRQQLASKLPQSNADIAPGLVPNVMTGRIANRLDLKGPNYLVDAACSSSLLAINAAMDELRNGRSRMMLAGGVNASLPAEVSVIFTQLGALSERGKVRPFEEGSDGTLLGEGLGIVVLKRLSDALESGDRIYAVLRGVGQASDGRGQGLLAPSVEGETLAMVRAYAASGVDPASIEMIEAHGTGIPLGDRTEISALKNVFGERKGALGSIALGSVKSMISHCIPAAGIAGLIKSALALHHGILPPTLCEKINNDLGIDTTPLYVNVTPRPWIGRPGELRRAGVNSFGFGGINTHAIIEEPPAQAVRHQALSAWPCELLVFSAADAEALGAKLGQVAELIACRSDLQLSDLAATLIRRDAGEACRLAMVAKDFEDLGKKLDQARKRLQKPADIRWATRNGLCFSQEPLNGKVAFMFPGEGSQYLGMLEDLVMHFPEVRCWFDFWRGLYQDQTGESRTDIVFPPLSELTEERRRQLDTRLHAMDVGSEAVFVASQALHALLKSLDVQPDVMIGHSTGESSALAAAGAMPVGDFSGLADLVRELNRIYRRVLDAGQIPTGALLTVGALPREAVDQQVAHLDQGVVVAMDNCSNQQVLFGEQAAIESLHTSLSEAGGICALLPFDRGYHTPRFAAVSEAFLGYYEDIDLQAPAIPLYSCATAGLFPEHAADVKRLAAKQWATTVRFRQAIEQMHADGVRYFIEVGPAGNLCAFVNDILSGRDYLALATDNRRKGAMEQLLTVLSHLYVNGKPFQADRLYASRNWAEVSLESVRPAPAAGMLLNNTLPIVHVDADDRTALQTLLGPVLGTGPAGGLPVTSPGLATGGREALMEEHFRQMRGLLDQQQAALGAVPTGIAVGSPDGFAPLLSRILEQDGRRCRAECQLSVYEDNFLRDHILSGRVSEADPELLGLSCVPLMVSLEVMAEACALCAGSSAVRTIANIKAFDWIALDDGEVTLAVQAELVDPVRRVYAARIFNDAALVVSADFAFAADWQAEPVAALAGAQRYRWASEELYSTGMFHGPIFQSIARIDGFNEQGIDAGLSPVRLEGFFQDNVCPSLILNPVLLDALGQLAAFWIAQQVGTDFNSFPSTIERIELYRDCPENLSGLTLRARQQPVDPSASAIDAPRAWQFECLDQQGQPLVRAMNLVNIYFPVPNRFYAVRHDPLRGWLGQLYEGLKAGSATLWQLPHLPEEFCRQSGGIFLRILAHTLLSFEEREEWRALAGNVRQQRRWLLGRACLKEAVRYWVYQQTGQLLYPADIVVLHDDHGAPLVDGWWTQSLVAAPAVSLCHNRRMSLAAVSWPGSSIGVDAEYLGDIRYPDLIEGALCASERAALKDLPDRELPEQVLRIWCAKESAAKALGTGLLGQPEKFVVFFSPVHWGRAMVRFEETSVEVFLTGDGDMVVALATNLSS